MLGQRSPFPKVTVRQVTTHNLLPARFDCIIGDDIRWKEKPYSRLFFNSFNSSLIAHRSSFLPISVELKESEISASSSSSNDALQGQKLFASRASHVHDDDDDDDGGDGGDADDVLNF